MKKGLESIRDPLRREYLSLVLREVEREFGESLVSFAVYGSVARGDEKKESDTDVLLVLDVDLGYGERCRRLGRVLARAYESGVGRRLVEEGYNPFVEFYPLDPEEASAFRPIYLDMVEDAVVLLDRGGFLERILKKVSKLLERLGSRRVRTGEGEWFWILKPGVELGEEVSYELE